MDPFNLTNATLFSNMPMNNFLLVPGVFGANNEDNEFLNSLDYETREYVQSHSSDFQSRDEVIEFVNRLHKDDSFK